MKRHQMWKLRQLNDKQELQSEINHNKQQAVAWIKGLFLPMLWKILLEILSDWLETWPVKS